MTMTLDTYSPTELGEYLAKLGLKGLKIVGIESPSVVYGAQKKEILDKDEQKFETCSKDVTVDLETILIFENGRKVGFSFTSASHVFIYEHGPDFKMDTADYNPGSVSISDILSDVVGKTIADFKIRTSNNTGYDFEDAGFDENQDEYIKAFDLIFTDDSRLGFMCDIDFMTVYYER